MCFIPQLMNVTDLNNISFSSVFSLGVTLTKKKKQLFIMRCVIQCRNVTEQHLRSFLAAGDDEAVSQCGVHGEHRARMSFGHNSY